MKSNLYFIALQLKCIEILRIEYRDFYMKN